MMKNRSRLMAFESLERRAMLSGTVNPWLITKVVDGVRDGPFVSTGKQRDHSEPHGRRHGRQYTQPGKSKCPVCG